MSQRLITLDFNVAKTILLGMRGSLRRSRMDMIKKWLDKMDEIVDKAVLGMKKGQEKKFSMG